MSLRGVHVYTCPQQPATRYRDPFLKRIVTRRATAVVPTSCCRRRRVARNCTTQVYYDAQPFWCSAGKGCKRKTRYCRVTARVLAREFKSGLSFVGLARKYGMTVTRVEDRVRGYVKGRRV